MSTFVLIHGAGSEAWYRHLLVPDASASRQTDGRGHLPALARPKDLAAAGEELEPNSSAALLVWEDVWATKLRDAILNAGGEVLDLERLPYDVVQAAVEFANANKE